jgi:hypothetical protein
LDKLVSVSVETNEKPVLFLTSLKPVLETNEQFTEPVQN